MLFLNLVLILNHPLDNPILKVYYNFVVLLLQFLKKIFSKVASAILMEHFLCDGVGDKRNTCVKCNKTISSVCCHISYLLMSLFTIELS